jgi:hypothetical protein
MIPKNRREKLLSQLDDGALVIISTNPQQELQRTSVADKKRL